MSRGTDPNSQSRNDARPFAGLPCHKDNYVVTIEYSPDDQFLATGSSDGTIRLWNSQTGRQVREFKASGPLGAFSFSPSGRRLGAICKGDVAGKPGAHVYVWSLDKEADTEGAEVKTEYENIGYGSQHRMVSFSSDERIIAAMLPTRILLQDVQTGSLLMEVPAASGRTFQRLLAFSESSNDRKLLYGYSEGDRYKVSSFDVNSKQEVDVNLSVSSISRKVPGMTLPFLLVYSRERNTLAGALEEGSVQLWDAETGNALHRPLAGKLGDVSSLCFSQDGEWVINGSESNALCLWDTLTGKPALAPLRHWAQLQVKLIACSPRKDRIACVDQRYQVHVWDIRRETLVFSSVPNYQDKSPPFSHYPQYHVDTIHWFPNGRHFVTTANQDDYIRTWDAQTGEQVYDFYFHGGPRVALSPDGDLLAVGPTRDSTRPIVLLDAKTGKEYSPPLMSPGRKVRKLEFSPNSSILAVLLATVDGNNLHLVHDVLGQRKVEAVPQDVFDVTFSPDEEHFAYVTADEYPTWLGHTICVCHVATLEITAKMQTRKKSAKTHCLSFSADGRRILDASDKGDTALWDLTTEQKMFDIPLDDQTRHKVSFSPDDRTILSGWWMTTKRAGADLFNAVSGDRIWRIEEKQVPTVFAFAPAGDRIAMGFNDGSFKLYDTSTGRVILPKGEEEEEGKPLDKENIPAASKRRPGLSGFADLDDESILNMPTTSARFTHMQGEGIYARQETSQGRQKLPQSGPRPGLIARLISRLASPSSGPRRERHRWPRAIQLVSMGRATQRNVAGDDRPTTRSRTERRGSPEEDEDSTSPSPSQSARSNSPREGAADDASRESSESGCWDVVRYCLCFTCC